jgi:hypothetical protein
MERAIEQFCIQQIEIGFCATKPMIYAAVTGLREVLDLFLLDIN